MQSLHHEQQSSDKTVASASLGPGCTLRPCHLGQLGLRQFALILLSCCFLCATAQKHGVLPA
jgi:hypothetical protein